MSLFSTKKIEIDFNEYIDTKGPELFKPYYPGSLKEVNIRSNKDNKIVKTYYHFKLDNYAGHIKYYDFLDLKGLSDRLTENPNKNDDSYGKKLIYFTESTTKLNNINNPYIFLFKNWENLPDGSIENIEFNLPFGYSQGYVNKSFFQSYRPFITICFAIDDNNYNNGKFGLDIVKKFKGCIIKGGSIGFSFIDFRTPSKNVKKEIGLIIPLNLFDGNKNHTNSLINLFGNKHKENLNIIGDKNKGNFITSGIDRITGDSEKREKDFGKIIDNVYDFMIRNGNTNLLKFCIMDNLEGIYNKSFGFPVIENAEQIKKYNEIYKRK